MSRNAPGGNAALDFITTGSKDSRKIGLEIFGDQVARDPFKQFTGDSVDNCVIAVGETKKEGTSCTIFISTDLIGAGVKGNQNLDENIDEDTLLPFTFRGNLLANSFESPVDKLKTRSALTKQRGREKKKLSKWFGLKTVKEKFYTISNDPTNQVIVKNNGDVKTTVADLAAGDTFNTYVIDELLKRAEDGYTDANDVKHPPLESVYVEKTMEHGIEQTTEFYPIFVGPASFRSLENDPRWIEAQKSKAHQKMSSYIRGFAGVYRNAVIIKVPTNSPTKAGIIRSDSPDFTGMSGSYTGFNAYKASDDTDTEINFILGAGALALGFDEEPRYAEDGNWDSGRKILFWSDQFFGVKKVRWSGETTAEKASIYHNKDYGVIVAINTIK